MGASGGFPIDIILFGMIAAFLVLRLKGILGRRTGFERPQRPMQPREVPAAPREVPAVPPPVAASRPIPEPLSALGQTLSRMKTIDRNFDPVGFLDGAEKAFRMIVTGFASGDRARLRPLLGDETWRAFDLAITEREKAGQTQVTDVKAIQGLTIEAAELKGTVASITVRITSDQVNMTHSDTGQTVSGTDAVTEIHDVWTFERNLADPSPAWHLVAARSA
jgi:predicted lipid-binding transport protein (Tim44 family)